MKLFDQKRMSPSPQRAVQQWQTSSAVRAASVSREGSEEDASIRRSSCTEVMSKQMNRTEKAWASKKPDWYCSSNKEMVFCGVLNFK